MTPFSGTRGPPGLAEQPMPSSQQLLAQLLEQQQAQNRLLAQQLALLQQSQAAPVIVYNDPQDLLKQVDPTLQHELSEWAKEYKTVLQHLASQTTLQQKYLALVSAGELHKQFRDDAKKSWQWPAVFKTEVKEVSVCKDSLAEGEVDLFAGIDPERPFELDAAFRALREKHARECQAFVFTYQRQCVDFFTRRANPKLQKELLEDRFQSWVRKNAAVISPEAVKSLQSQVVQFAELTFRTEQPKIVSRHEKERAKRAKQREELTKAEAEFRLMDVNKLLAMAMLEQTTLSSQSSANRQRVVPPHGALAYFLKQYPELAVKYKLTTCKPDGKPKTKQAHADKARGRSKSSHKSGGSSAGRRSASRVSSQSRASNGCKQIARRSNRSASQNSQSSKKGDHKGKSKGKGRGRGKGTKKAVRMQTPAPHRKFRLRKMSLVQLERRFTSPVHILTPSVFQIPVYVVAYLAKGCKFIADRRPSTVQRVLREVDCFERNLQSAVFFQGKSSLPLEPSKCRTKSTWTPPADPGISLYCRLLKEELSRYEPQVRKPNEDFVDKAARQWLAEHRHHVCVVDADKNLGDALVPRSWVREESLRLLTEAATTISSETYVETTVSLKYSLDSFFHQALFDGLVSPKLLKFLIKDFDSTHAGTFRLRIKLHKNPVVGRPIMNLSRAWIAPSAIFLTEALKPALKQLRHVISSSGDIVGLLAGKRAPSDFILCTFDIRNLYPSIDRGHFLEKVSQHIRRFWAQRPQYGAFLIQLVEFVLAFQFVQFEGQLWQVTKGLPTGLQTSVVFANLYLASLDDFIVNRFPAMNSWYRYIDDALGIIHKDETNAVYLELHQWHENIKWDLSGQGLSVPFLDLELTLQDGFFSFQTFRKAQNAYLYIPRTSCHPEGVFKALISGESQRIFRTCHGNHKAVQRQLSFFLDRLQKRGYNRKEAEILSAQTLRRLNCRASRTKTNMRKFFFRQEFTFSLNRKCINVALKRHWHLIQSCFKQPVGAVLSFRVQPNLFRRDFATNWLCAARSGSGGQGPGFLCAEKTIM
eukprot:Skav205271  [mRNA]  locus=scaffold1841:195276:198494:+ [translate_table: standard]